MGKVTGFIEWDRLTQPRRPVHERLDDWREVYRMREAHESVRQAGRCMDCGVPYCQNGCPLRNVIPDWNDLVYSGRWRDAYASLDSTNNFPEFTGRLCPAPCEGSCTLGIAPTNAPVTIEHIEMEIIERAYQEGWVVARPPMRESGRSVAVVGSGPSGLAAAQQLRRAGHRVVVFERDDRPGGLMRYGIPDFKMEKAVLDRRIALMEAEGVEFRCSIDVGGVIEWASLQRDFDAVLIAIGAQKDRALDVPGRDLTGVETAMRFLTRQNRIGSGLDRNEGGPLDAKDKHVVILGGGDTGSDCYGTALRQGAKSVLQIELMPAPPATRALENPWPEWPVVFRTSSSHEEGGARDFALMTERLIGKDGVVTGVEMTPIDMLPGDDGRKRPTPTGEPTRTVDADLVILAIGFTGPKLDGIGEALGIETPGGRIGVTNYATNVEGVFAAGDAMRGASLIVWAIADGRKAAAQVDEYLRSGETSTAAG